MYEAIFAIQKENYPAKGTKGKAYPDKFSRHGAWCFVAEGQENIILVNRDWISIPDSWGF